MKLFTSKTQKIGQIGEDIACKFLMKKGFSIVERNYTKKYGEIDIVAEKRGVVHFIEVKSVSANLLNKTIGDNETYFRAEDNLSDQKMKKFKKMVEVYLIENRVSHETGWQVDALIVEIDSFNKKANVKIIDNIIL